MDILSKFLPSQLPRNCSKPFRTLVIHGDMARHGSYPTKNLEIHTPPASKLAQIRLLTRLIPTFSACLGLETHDFAQRLLKIQTFFSEFQGAEALRNAPNCGASIFWALPLRPRAIVVLGVHRGAFAQQKLCRRDVAVVRRPMQRCVASGSFSPGAVDRCGRSRGKRRTLWAAELYPFNRQTNDECFGFNIFKTVQSKKNKKHSQTIANTRNKFQYILPTNYLQ